MIRFGFHATLVKRKITDLGDNTVYANLHDKLYQDYPDYDETRSKAGPVLQNGILYYHFEKSYECVKDRYGGSRCIEDIIHLILRENNRKMSIYKIWRESHQSLYFVVTSDSHKTLEILMMMASLAL